MDVPRSTQAEETASRLQRAAETGVPVPIPGALEARAVRAAGRSGEPAAEPVAPLLVPAPSAAKPHA